MGSDTSPPSCRVFLPLPLLQAFQLLVAGQVPLLLPSPHGLFIYSSVRDCSSPASVLWAPRPLCYVSFFIVLLFSLFFSFFPGWVLVCPGGYAELAQGCLWEYHVQLNSPGGLLLSSRLDAGVWWHQALLVSLFNVMWRCYAWAGGVVVLEFYLFLVVFSAQCSPASLQDFTLGSTLSASSL
jgi:hypothetical protein